MKRAAIVLIFAGIASMASADDRFTEWGRLANRGFAECSMVGKASQIMDRIGAADFEKSRACANEKLADMRKSFESLLPIAKSSAQSAWKDYYVAWIAAMKALPSQLADSASEASAEQTRTRQRLDELWARFEMEAGM